MIRRDFLKNLLGTTAAATVFGTGTLSSGASPDNLVPTRELIDTSKKHFWINDNQDFVNIGESFQPLLERAKQVYYAHYSQPQSIDIFDGICAEDIEISDACFIGSDNKIYRSTISEDNKNGIIFGWSALNQRAGRPLTLYIAGSFYYSDEVKSNQVYYLHESFPGKLSSVRGATAIAPAAYGLPDGKIQINSNWRQYLGL